MKNFTQWLAGHFAPDEIEPLQGEIESIISFFILRLRNKYHIT